MISKQCKRRVDLTINLQSPFTTGTSCSLIKLNSRTTLEKNTHAICPNRCTL